MKKAIFTLILVLLFVSPAMAEYTAMRQYSGATLASSTTDRNAPGAPGGQMPDYWLSPSSELFPKVNQRVIVITQNDPEFGSAVFDAMTMLGRSRGIVVLKNAKPKNNDLVFTISPKTKQGSGWSQSSDYNSNSSSWNYRNRSESSGNNNSSNDSTRKVKVSLKVRSTVVQIVEGDEAGAFSPEEFGPTAVIKSAQTSYSGGSAHSDNYSSNRPRNSYSTSSSSSSSYSAGEDEGFAADNMAQSSKDERANELAKKFFWGYLRWLQETGRIGSPTNSPTGSAGVPVHIVH